ncbi:methyltransferase [Psychromonas hadalis]|uniref:methyltransferase n=1 Tax=Psychromonas hadalis TaxID=211669 RepID=UPI0004067038|nr:methyltransferase [Psychromonas hadalis]
MYNKTFAQLDEYLTALTVYWLFEAFHYKDYPWHETNPALSDFLDNLSEQELQHYQQFPDQLTPFLYPFIKSLRPLTDDLFTVNKLTSITEDLPFWLSTGIKGRKWSQISAFADQVESDLNIIEWCAGKGHLGRLISWQKKLPVLSIEWQQTLCDVGESQAKKQQVQQIFKQADVLKGQADSCINTGSHVISLHACGDLHLHLIKLAKQKKPQQLTISPCCYHLTEQSIYQPCSLLAKKSSLILSKQILKLAVSKQITTGKRQSRLSETEVLWRLAFDECQKYCLQTERYCPLPSFPKKLLTGEFKAFVLWAMHKKSLTFTLPEMLQPFLVLAESRLKKVRRMELISQFFVRPLELWLVYDRVLALQESGYQVKLSTFCASQITPRNLLIEAQL